jgi:hypothetical protein
LISPSLPTHQQPKKTPGTASSVEPLQHAEVLEECCCMKVAHENRSKKPQTHHSVQHYEVHNTLHFSFAGTPTEIANAVAGH